MCPVITSSIACNLPTARAMHCDPLPLVVVPRFTYGFPNLAWRAPHAPHEHKFHLARVAHGMCEALRPTAARGCADVHLGLQILAMDVHSLPWIKSAWIKKTMSSLT